MEIKTNPFLFSHPVPVIVAGCGGTGSQVATLLARLHLALIANGHPHGLNVSLYDPDVVSEANVGRQLFYRSDIGKNKAEVLAKRINFAYGLDFSAHPVACVISNYHGPSFLIGCVDSIKSRNILYPMDSYDLYAIDCGNGADYGQVLLQIPGCETLVDLAPDLIAGEDSPDDGPSCSLAEALTKQELLVNDFAARIAVQMIWQMMRRGSIDYNAVYYNLKTMKMVKRAIPEKKEKKNG